MWTAYSCCCRPHSWLLTKMKTLHVNKVLRDVILRWHSCGSVGVALPQGRSLWSSLHTPQSGPSVLCWHRHTRVSSRFCPVLGTHSLTCPLHLHLEKEKRFKSDWIQSTVLYCIKADSHLTFAFGSAFQDHILHANANISYEHYYFKIEGVVKTTNRSEYERS